LRFSAESDNEIAAYGNPRHALSASRQHFLIIFDRVEAFHPPQNLIAARLRRDMQIRAHLGQLPDGVEQIITHVARKIRDELDALDSCRVMNSCQQIGKPETSSVAKVVLVAVDGLAQERDFLAAFTSQLPNFGGDEIGVPALFRTANLRYNAISAKLITADHDSDIGLKSIGPHRGIAKRIVALKAARDFRA